MNISFGKKIPIMKCQVQNLKTKDFVPSTVYEYDCEDKHDANNIDKIDGYWIFKPQIFFQAQDKHCFPQKYKNTKIYSLETNTGETLGMMVLDKAGNNNNVDVLETKFQSGHKYVGKSLLAAAAQETLKGSYKKLTITHPIPDVRDFYIDSCVFKETSGRPLEMNNEDLMSFIKTVEKSVHTNFIDLQG